jgi:ribosomal protein S18 acetylase RimI-like enzyme
MDEVLEIENSSFQFPWSEAEFLTALKQRNDIACVYES